MAGVERKVTAATVGAYLGGLVSTWLVANTALGGLPPDVLAVLAPVPTAAATFAVAWLVRHTPRTALAGQVRRLVRAELRRQLAQAPSDPPTTPSVPNARHAARRR